MHHPIMMPRIAAFGRPVGFAANCQCRMRAAIERAAYVRTKLRGAHVENEAQGSYDQAYRETDASVKQTFTAIAKVGFRRIPASCGAEAGCRPLEMALKLP